ncbi:MAG: hypothetical protein AAGK09_12735 [Planctomycetota bacterium]
MQVDKIHSIRQALSEGPMFENPYDRKPIGVINLKVTRVIAFVIISLAVIATAVVCILAVWQVFVPDYAWRSLGSLGIIAAATAVFVALNEGFGPAIREPFPPSRRPEPEPTAPSPSPDDRDETRRAA